MYCLCTNATMKFDCISPFVPGFPTHLRVSMNMMMRRKTPSLVDLCIRTAIDNVRYLGDVGETDIELLSHILPHCTVDQLRHIEKCTEVRQLDNFKLNMFVLFS